eukprot:COSAG01_NODE_22937_length_835_cov_1.449728_1_plen_79_part_10
MTASTPELEPEPEPEPQSVHQTELEVQLQPMDSGGFLHVSSMDGPADDFVTSKEEDELAQHLDSGAVKLSKRGTKQARE